MPISVTAFVCSTTQLSTLGQRKKLSSRAKCARQHARAARPVTRMGLIPFIPNWIALAAWGFGAYRFYLGFDRTSYQSSFRIPLALAWPILFAVNGSYRKNFTKSIKGSDDGY